MHVRDSAIIFVLLALATTGTIVSDASASKMKPQKDIAADETAGECIQTTAPGIMGCGVFPTDDTFADNLLPAKPMKQDISLVLIVQDTPSVPVSKNYAFLKFNLTSVIPKTIFSSHAQPMNASLWLYAQYATGFPNASVRVYDVPSGNWSENALTWNNMPPIDMSHFSANRILALDRWYRWNVTSDVTRDIQGNGTASFALIAGFTSWSNYAWFTSKENVTYSPQLDVYFREPTLTLATPFPHLPITIDGRPMQADNSGSLEVTLLWGPHNITVPDTIPEQQGVRELFTGWNDNISSATRMVNVGNNMTLRASYGKQYSLEVTSPYATTGGSGWYFADQSANVSVQPTWVFSESWLGMLGVRHVFDHWEGACTTSQPDCTLSMNGPKETTAVWREDCTIPIAVAAIVAVAAVILWLRRSRRR